MTRFFKIEVYVPLSHADAVRRAIGEAGAGIFGNYSHCSFSTRGIGRFKGNESASPVIGSCHVNESVEEEKIETQITQDKLKYVLEALKKAHPYEEMVYQIIELINPNNL